LENGLSAMNLNLKTYRIERLACNHKVACRIYLRHRNTKQFHLSKPQK